MCHNDMLVRGYPDEGHHARALALHQHLKQDQIPLLTSPIVLEIGDGLGVSAADEHFQQAGFRALWREN
jgi:hypothetical protein